MVRPADLLCPAYAHCHTRNEKTHPREEFTRRPLGASLGQPTIRRWLSSTTTSPLDATDAACASSNFVAPVLFLPGSDADQADSIDPIRHDLPNPLIFGIIKSISNSLRLITESDYSTDSRWRFRALYFILMYH